MPTNVRNSRSALAADFAATNPWLGDGEERIETDTGKSKTGPGYWNDLTYGAGQDGAPSGASVQPVAQVTDDGSLDFTAINLGNEIALLLSRASDDGDLSVVGTEVRSAAGGLFLVLARGQANGIDDAVTVAITGNGVTADPLVTLAAQYGGGAVAHLVMSTPGDNNGRVCRINVGVANNDLTAGSVAVSAAIVRLGAVPTFA